MIYIICITYYKYYNIYRYTAIALKWYDSIRKYYVKIYENTCKSHMLRTTNIAESNQCTSKK